jgi:nicotinic acid mononucleotide adenylyltransferase/predicted RNA-binding protein with PIN domain
VTNGKHIQPQQNGPQQIRPQQTRGVYPGSFDPLTVAHVAIAEAAKRAAGLDRVDLALSRVALGKERATHSSIDSRAEAIRRAARSRPWLAVAITDAQLIAEIAAGYDAVVMGADKWAQVRDPAWYGGNAAARDAALASLPRVLVAPRPGFDVVGAEVLEIDPEHAHVSSTRARSGEPHLVAGDARRRLLVDGNNVVGTRPDGWWRDRAGAARRFIGELQSHAARTGDEIAVVFDGRPLDGLAEGVHDGVRIAYARRRGRDAGDDRIVEEIRGDDDPSALTVVTSDRALAERARRLGAGVESAGTLTRELGSERP